jgi:thioredoxin-dependent peroxiredoxin
LLIGIFALGVLILAGADTVVAKAKKKDKPNPKIELKVKPGEDAPAFECTDEAGKPFKSTDVIGKKVVVLFFYGADFTGNSVAEARSFQDELDKLDQAVVLGISGDSPATHKLFKTYYKLGYTLLADEKGEVAKAFGVPVGKSGKTTTINAKNEKSDTDRAVTLDRWTVVIDKAGKIADIGPIPPKKGPSDEGKRVADIVKKLEAK